jgi:hypothetical protein
MLLLRLRLPLQLRLPSLLLLPLPPLLRSRNLSRSTIWSTLLGDSSSACLAEDEEL